MQRATKDEINFPASSSFVQARQCNDFDEEMERDMTHNILAIISAAFIAATASPAVYSQSVPANPQIDYEGFSKLTNEVASYRSQRLVSLSEFKRLSSQGDAMIFDTRSAEAFARGHFAGAVNLPFSDFTQDKLDKIIGDTNRPILIYCNNNFSDNRFPIATKSAPLALNIPTFINLYGYGYKNVFELNQIVLTAELGDDWVRSEI